MFRDTRTNFPHHDWGNDSALDFWSINYW